MKDSEDTYKSNKQVNTKKYLFRKQIINEAINFHLKGDIQEAIKYYREIINLEFNDPNVFSNYGIILKNQGNLKEAELYTRKAIEIKPNFANAHSNLGNILRDQGNLEEAELSQRKAIEIDPNLANAYSDLGTILNDLGNLKEAELYTRKAIEIDPNILIAHSNLGIILKSLGHLEEAELSQRKAIALYPDFAIAHSNLGNILRDQGNLEEAELSQRKAIEIDPNLAIAHSNLGNILRDQGNLKEAESYVRKAIELDPNLAIAHSNLGNILRDQGNLKEAEIAYIKAIEIDPNLAIVYSNLGIIFKDQGNLKEAESYVRKAIEIDPNLAIAYSNLGGIFKDIGNLKEVEILLRKAIDLDPDLVKPYYLLSTIKYSKKDKIWQNKIFSDEILNKKSKLEKVDIFFTRTNILHQEKKYKESSSYLKLANNIKLEIKPSNTKNLIDKSKSLFLESDKKVINQKKQKNFFKSIFIVGMPRSGSTLLESIISMNNDVYALGEINTLDDCYEEFINSNKEINLAEIYGKEVLKKTKLNITTNKNLYNYQYAGIIANQIPNAKIIHCFRHPLDNILSIYRANFGKGNEYSSSLSDCAKVYIEQEEIMNEYKKRFKAIIYDLNYDLLVNNPDKEIKSLIAWLGWKWDNKYLSPHLNPRTVSTASNVQVRSPINSKSIGGWKNYKEMLKPAIEIITRKTRYRKLI